MQQPRTAPSGRTHTSWQRCRPRRRLLAALSCTAGSQRGSNLRSAPRCSPGGGGPARGSFVWPIVRGTRRCNDTLWLRCALLLPAIATVWRCP